MKRILITGSSQGLGLEIANSFLKEGWQVIGLSRRDPSIKDNRYTHYSVDISNQELVKSIFKEIGSIDVLVNNAAVFKMSAFADIEESEIDKILDTNLKGSIYVTKYAVPKMSKGSKIIFINSVAGLRELENQSIYCASKHGLTAFAGVLGKELQPQGITVTSIHPGGINTPLWNESNPYPVGNVENALDTSEVSRMVHYIATCPVTYTMKTVTLFPNVEWH